MEETNLSTLAKMVAALCDEKKYAALRDALSKMNASDIAAIFEDIPRDLLPIVFRLLQKDLAAEVFVEMEGEEQEFLIHSFSDSELKEVIDEMYIDDAADLVEEMPANVVTRILSNVDVDTRKLINEILKYPEDSAGSIMTVEYVSLRPSMTVEDAIKRIRRVGIDKETIYTCYVTNDDKTLMGMVSVRTLLLAEEDEIIEDIMEPNVIYIHTLEDQEVVANYFKKYNFIAMPVVDDEKRLVGIVTVDDALDVMEDEATEDIERMNAIAPSDKPYLKQNVFETCRARIPWLMVLMISGTFSTIIISSFNSVLQQQIALSAYMTMLADTGGNSGSQASVSVIRALSLGDVKYTDIFRVMWKEARVALICGMVLAVVSFLKALFFDRAGMAVASTLGLTIMCTVMSAKLIGCSLPILSKRIGLDPAIMASPMITTIVDVITLLIYFTLAKCILHL